MLGAAWLAIGLLGSACRDSAPPSPTRLPNRPNILVVLSDTHRADHTPRSEAATDLAMPNLRRFADSSTTFVDVTTVAPISAPSYASLFTGVPPTEHGLLNNFQRLGPELPVLAELLRDSGYATAAVVSNPTCPARLGFDRGFSEYRDDFEGRGRWGRFVTDDAIAWLEERSDGRPFFLFTAYMDAHKPYFFDQNPPSVAILLNGTEVARLAAGNRYVLNRIPLELRPGVNNLVMQFLRVDQPATPADAVSPLLIADLGVEGAAVTFETGRGLIPIAEPVPHFQVHNRAHLRIDNLTNEPSQAELVFRGERLFSNPETPPLYRKGVASFDFHFGRLIEYLRDRELLDSTAVVLLSDHGEMLGEHDAWDHVSHLYPGTLSIPLMIKAPGFPVNEISVAPLSLLDVSRLIQRIADGIGLSEYRPVLDDGIRVAGTFPPEAAELLVSVQDARFRLLTDGDDRWELFDLTKDPDELDNIFAARSSEQRIAELIARAERELTVMRATESLDLESLSPRERAELQALGYLEPE